MKEIVNYLTKLDFSKVEIKLYLTLLKYGSMSIAQLAEKVKINRSATYGHIDTLFKKGILIKTKGARNEISANSPENLKYLIENKINTAKRLELEFPEILQSLNYSLPTTEGMSNSEIKYYKGRLGAKVVYEECLRSNELRSYFDAATMGKVFPNNAQLFHQSFESNPKIVIHEILEDSLGGREQVKHAKNERYSYKFFPADVKLFANDILIYDGKVAIINVRDKNNIHGVIISNEDYYNNSKLLFDLLWRLLPDPKI